MRRPESAGFRTYLLDALRIEARAAEGGRLLAGSSRNISQVVINEAGGLYYRLTFPNITKAAAGDCSISFTIPIHNRAITKETGK